MRLTGSTSDPRDTATANRQVYPVLGFIRDLAKIAQVFEVWRSDELWSLVDVVAMIDEIIPLPESRWLFRKTEPKQTITDLVWALVDNEALDIRKGYSGCTIIGFTI
jgi:hypothetical protein